MLLIKNRDLIYAATLVNNIGNGMHTIALASLLFQKTQSSLLFALVVSFEYFIAFIQPFSGHFADRRDPKFLCVSIDLTRGILLALTCLVFTWTHNIQYILLGIVVVKVLGQFYYNASFALTPLCIGKEKIEHVVGVNASFFQVGQILGIALVGLLLGRLSIETIFFIDAITYLISGILLSLLVPREQMQRPKDPTKNHLAHSWVAFIKSKSRNFWLHTIFSAADFLAIAVINICLVPLVALRFGNQGIWLSILDGAFAFGAIAGSFLVRILARGKYEFLWPGLQGLLLALLSLDMLPSLHILFFFGLGLFNCISVAFMIGRLQKRIRDDERGKTSGLRRIILAMLASILLPLFSSLLGKNLSIAMLFAGGFLLLVGIALGFIGSHIYEDEGPVV